MQASKKSGHDWLGFVSKLWHKIWPKKTVRWELFVIFLGAQCASCFVLFAYGFVAGGCLTVASVITAALALATRQRAAVLFHAFIAFVTMLFFVIGTGYRIDGVEPIHDDSRGVAFSITQACLSIGFMCLAVVIGYSDGKDIGECSQKTKASRLTVKCVDVLGPQVRVEECDSKNYFTTDEFQQIRESILRGVAGTSNSPESESELVEEAQEFLRHLGSRNSHCNDLRPVVGQVESWCIRSFAKSAPLADLESPHNPRVHTAHLVPSTSPPQLMEDSSPFGSLYASREVPRNFSSNESEMLKIGDPSPSEPLPPTRTPVAPKFVGSATGRRPTSASTTELFDVRMQLTTEEVEDEHSAVPCFVDGN